MKKNLKVQVPCVSLPFEFLYIMDSKRWSLKEHLPAFLVPMMVIQGCEGMLVVTWLIKGLPNEAEHKSLNCGTFGIKKQDLVMLANLFQLYQSVDRPYVWILEAVLLVWCQLVYCSYQLMETRVAKITIDDFDSYLALYNVKQNGWHGLNMKTIV